MKVQYVSRKSMCLNSVLDTVEGSFHRITDARFGKGKTAPCSLDLNEARYGDLGVSDFQHCSDP